MANDIVLPVFISSNFFRSERMRCSEIGGLSAYLMRSINECKFAKNVETSGARRRCVRAKIDRIKCTSKKSMHSNSK